MKFTLTFIMGMALAALLWLGAFYALLGTPTSRSAGLFETYSVKQEIMASTPAPRLVLIGGSGVYMGIGADILSEKLGIPVINFGIFAGFDLAYQMQLIESHLQAGDVVLLAYEYAAYEDAGQMNAGTLKYVMERDAARFTHLPVMSQLKQIYSAGIGSLFRWGMAAGLPQMDRARQYPQETINAQGDQTINRQTSNLQKVAALKPIPFASNAVSEASQQLLHGFVSRLRERDIAVLATWPNMLSFEDYKTPQTQQFFVSIEQVYAENNVPMLGSTDEFLLPPEMIYDTVYHLNKAGVTYRSNALAEYLKAQPVIKAMIASYQK